MREYTNLSLHLATITSTASGVEVDLADYIHVGRREVKATLDVIANGGDSDETLDYKLQESDTTVDGDFADISGAAFTQVTQPDGTSHQEIHARVNKQFVRGVATPGGTTPSFAVAANLLVVKRAQPDA